MCSFSLVFFFFFFNDTATTEIYTLSLHDALPISSAGLSSSAALECATALALGELYGLDLPRPELATLAWRAENDFVGVPSGIMDQSASLLSEAGHALLLDCRSGETAAV